ncbi:PTS galactitol transporter subunit IIC, partial [Salmonella enterica]
FTWQNVVAFAVIAIIYFAGVLLTWRRARNFVAAEKAAAISESQPTS